jgi:transposase
MYSVELYARVRRACHVDGLSKSAAGRLFGIDRKTVAKILEHSVPPGYRRAKPPARPKLDPFIPIIDQILEDDKSQLKKQRHTAKRVFERLRDEHGFTGGITIVTDYIREKKRRTREVFVPLTHPPGRLCRFLCPGAFRYAIGKRSSNMIANWLFTACHSRTERFHSVDVVFSAR